MINSAPRTVRGCSHDFPNYPDLQGMTSMPGIKVFLRTRTISVFGRKKIAAGSGRGGQRRKQGTSRVTMRHKYDAKVKPAVWN